MNISVERTGNKIRSCSCNSCCAKNYDTSDGTDKRVDVLYDVQIGGMLNCLCEDCLKYLIEVSTIAIANQKGEEV